MSLSFIIVGFVWKRGINFYATFCFSAFKILFVFFKNEKMGDKSRNFSDLAAITN